MNKVFFPLARAAMDAKLAGICKESLTASNRISSGIQKILNNKF